MSPKYRHPINEQPDVIYKIPCKDCKWSYIGVTGRSSTARKKDHVRNVKNRANGSNLANHAWTNYRVTYFDKGNGIDKGNF